MKGKVWWAQQWVPCLGLPWGKWINSKNEWQFRVLLGWRFSWIRKGEERKNEIDLSIEPRRGHDRGWVHINTRLKRRREAREGGN